MVGANCHSPCARAATFHAEHVSTARIAPVRHAQLIAEALVALDTRITRSGVSTVRARAFDRTVDVFDRLAKAASSVAVQYRVVTVAAVAPGAVLRVFQYHAAVCQETFASDATNPGLLRRS